LFPVTQTPHEIEVNLATVANAQGNDIMPLVVDGYVVLSAERMGDVNCDGERNAIDSLMTLQRDVGIREGSGSCTEPQRSKSIMLESSCDVTGDGLCNAVDALFTLQCDVGVDNASCVDDGTMMRTVLESNASGTVTVGSIPAGSSDKVVVPVMLKNALDIGTSTVEIHYNTSQIQSVTCVENEGIGLIQCNPNFGEGVVRVSAINSTGFAGDVMLAEITFEIAGTLEADLIPELVVDSSNDVQGEPFILETGSGISQLAQLLKLFLPLIER